MIELPPCDISKGGFPALYVLAHALKSGSGRSERHAESILYNGDLYNLLCRSVNLIYGRTAEF